MDTVEFQPLKETVECFGNGIFRTNGIWDGPSPFIPLLPLLFNQLVISIIFSRFIVHALKQFNQPSFVGEILSGILLGPTGWGKIFVGTEYVAFSSFRSLEPMTHLFLTYYAFLLGLQTDIRAPFRAGKKAMDIAISGIIIPFAIGSLLHLMMKKVGPQDSMGFIFYGAALSSTGVPVLHKILDKQRLIHTEVGKTAMAAGVISDLSSWFFLGLGLTLRGSDSSVKSAFISNVALVFLYIYCVRPFLISYMGETPEDQTYSETYIFVVLSGVLVFGFITDIFGTHPVIGGFIYGTSIPNKVLVATLTDKMEDLVMGVFMPLFYILVGLRTDLFSISLEISWFLVAIAVPLACSSKVLSTFTAFYNHEITPKEALAVGVLTSTKGVMVLVALEVSLTQQVITTPSYSLMVLIVLLTTSLVTPIAIFFRPSKDSEPYTRRSIQKAKPHEELRVLACLHNNRHISPLIRLLTLSKPSIDSPISVFVVQLLELIGRAAATLVVHISRKSSSGTSDIFSDAQVDEIIDAFDKFEDSLEGVTTQIITAKSAYQTMDEVICNVANDKRAAIIILPFHKFPIMDGTMEEIDPAIQSVNESVLANAACSVGIFIDRGGFSDMNPNASQKVAMLYFGGPDDRESLTYAKRMAESPDVSLSVVRFVPGEEAMQVDNTDFGDTGHVSLYIDMEKEAMLDEDFLRKFHNIIQDDESISYTELVLNDEEEAVRAIKSMDSQDYDLFIVGKGRGFLSPLTAGLADWCDCPELGSIGDLLVNSEFSSHFSVLVVQQYINVMGGDGGSVGMTMPSSFHPESTDPIFMSNSGSFGSFKNDYDR